MKQAAARYHLRFDRFGWQSGHLRLGRMGFYYLPRWLDNVQGLGDHLVLRAQGRCIQCRMPGGVHKMDCYHNWRIRDDLLQLFPRVHAWKVRHEEMVPPEYAREYWKTYWLAKVLPTKLLVRYLRRVGEREEKS